MIDRRNGTDSGMNKNDQAGAPDVRRRSRARAAERDSLALVLTLIRSGGAKTRQEIERASGLGRAIVADRTATLIDRGLVAEDDLLSGLGVDDDGGFEITRQGDGRTCDGFLLGERAGKN